jgi:hypothetical protein
MYPLSESKQTDESKSNIPQQAGKENSEEQTGDLQGDEKAVLVRIRIIMETAD